MYAWEGRPFDDIAILCARRDPRRYPLGCLTAGPGSEPPPVLQWFRDRPELSAFLHRMEPQRWGIRLNRLTDFKTRSQSVFVQLDVFGPSDELREAHNAISRPAFEIRWWGGFDALRSTAQPQPAALRTAFHGSARAVDDDELDAFVAFLRAQV
jgi:hypothetical protein